MPHVSELNLESKEMGVPNPGTPIPFIHLFLPNTFRTMKKKLTIIILNLSLFPNPLQLAHLALGSCSLY